MKLDAKQFYGVFVCASLVFCLLSWVLYKQVSGPEPHCDVDSKAYLERGLWFARTNKFISAQKPDQPYYALGYAAIIGVLYKLCGVSTNVIIVFQLLLALFSCFLMMRIAYRIGGNSAAWLAALFFCLSLGYYTFVQFVLTELVLSFLLLIFFERFLAFVTQQYNLRALCAAAFALGCSIIIKPAALFFIAIMLCFLACLVTIPWHVRLKQCLLCVFFFYVPVVSYMTYNYVTFGNFAVSTLDRVNVYYWFFPNVLAYENGTTSDIERNKLLALSHGKHDCAVVGKMFWHAAVRKPWLFAYVWMLNVVKTYAGLYTTNLKVLVQPLVHGGSISFFKMAGTMPQRVWAYITAGATKPWVIAVGVFEALFALVRYVLCLCGLWAVWRRRKYAIFVLFVCTILYFSLITGHDGCARFRMMFEYALIVLAAVGFAVCFDQQFTSRKVM